MPAPRLLLALFTLAGCAGSAPTVLPEAEPFVPAATRSVSGVEDYLEASGVDIAFSATKLDVENPGVEWVGRIEFVERGVCAVLQYQDVASARQFAPRSGGGDRYLRVTRTARGGRRATVRDRYKPTYRFGKMAVVCSDEPIAAAEALRALQTAAPPPK